MVDDDVVQADGKVGDQPEGDDGSKDHPHELCAIALYGKEKHQDADGHAVYGSTGEAGDWDLQALTG